MRTVVSAPVGLYEHARDHFLTAWMATGTAEPTYVSVLEWSSGRVIRIRAEMDGWAVEQAYHRAEWSDLVVLFEVSGDTLARAASRRDGDPEELRYRLAADEAAALSRRGEYGS